MKIQPYATLFAITLLASGVAARSHGTPEVKATRAADSLTEAIALRAHCDASLETLRAGRIEPSTLLGAADRAELRAAETRSPDLMEMRAGYLTDREWTMVAVGALIVILIILL